MNNLNIIFGIVFAWILMVILVILLYPKKEQKREPSIEDSLNSLDSLSFNGDSIILDAIAGLISLGYKQKEAKERVQKAWELLGNASTEQLLKKAMAI